MITPYGRYKWNRLPFGLKRSSKTFQKRLNNALIGLKEVFVVDDDIIVLGSGTTLKDAKKIPKSIC